MNGRNSAAQEHSCEVRVNGVGSPATAAAELDSSEVSVACDYLFFDGAAGIGRLIKNELTSLTFNNVVHYVACASNIRYRCDVDPGRFSLGIDFIYQYHANISNGLLWYNNHKNNQSLSLSARLHASDLRAQSAYFFGRALLR
jgi:hypothetical protein